MQAGAVYQRQSLWLAWFRVPPSFLKKQVVFRLLSKPAQLALLCQLRDKSLDVTISTERTGFSQLHLSRQLSQLEKAGLVTVERQGNRFPTADVPLIGDLCTLDSMAAARMVGGPARADERLILNLPDFHHSVYFTVSAVAGTDRESAQVRISSDGHDTQRL